MKISEFLKLAGFNFLIRIFEWVVPKDPHLWLIGMDDGGGVRLSGNSWYLLNFLKQNEDHVRVVAVTSFAEVEQQLKNLEVETVRPNTWKAFWLGLRGQVYFICGELHDEIPNFSKRNSIKVHLWHGVPLKKIFYGSPKMMERYNQRSVKMRILEWFRGRVELEEYDAIIYTSEGFKQIMMEAFNNPRLYLTGQPRDDAFYFVDQRDEILKELGLEEFKDHKIVGYLPTFRDSLDKRLNYKIFHKNPEAQESLAEQKIVVLQKDHNSILKERLSENAVVHLTNDVETQKLLKISDVLITDYSSVYIDFLHLQRPVIFYCYDLEKYTSQDRELYFDYFEDRITPGVKVKDEKSLLEAIEMAIKDPDHYGETRKSSLGFFHQHQDGENSRRVVQMAKQLIQERRPH